MSIQQYRPAGFNLLPEVVKNLLIINGIMFLATVVLEKSGIDLNDILGLHYVESEKFHWYQFITYMFMHGGYMHILLNMFALWMFGSPIENLWGKQKFLTYYILTGLGAGLTHYGVVHFQLQPVLTTLDDYIVNPSYDKLHAILSSSAFGKYSSIPEFREHANQLIDKLNSISSSDANQVVPMSIDYIRILKADVLNAPVVVGASGAVFGLLLAFGMLFPDTLLFMIPIPFPIKAMYAVIIYGAIELFSGVANLGDNIAHFAHLGGLVTGFIIMMYWRDQNRRRMNDFNNPY